MFSHGIITFIKAEAMQQNCRQETTLVLYHFPFNQQDRPVQNQELLNEAERVDPRFGAPRKKLYT